MHRYYMTEGYSALSHKTQVKAIKIIDESKKECENVIVDILKQGANEGLVRDADIIFNACMLQNLILNYAERCSNTKLSDVQKKED